MSVTAKAELGIVRLLAYGELFGYPLRQDELVTYTLVPECLDRNILESALTSLIERKIICQDATSGFYCFPDRLETIAIRSARRRVSLRLMRKAQLMVTLFALFPWVKLVAVTGSLAFSNSREDDDIDLLIITAPRRLWLTRALIFGLLRFLRLKSGQDRVLGRNAFCLNGWLDEEALAVDGSRCRLPAAFDILAMKILLNREGVLQRFLQANSWLDRFLPSSSSNRLPYRSEAGLKLRFGSFAQNLLILVEVGGDWFLDFAERLLRYGQQCLIKHKFKGVTHVSLSDHFLWQHPHDAHGRVLDLYESALARRLPSLTSE